MIMEAFSALAALLFVLGLFGAFAYGLKRSGLLPGHARIKNNAKQIEVLETKMIDGRNRLVLVAWRGKQYLLGTNPGGLQLIDSEEGAPVEDLKKSISDNEDS